MATFSRRRGDTYGDEIIVKDSDGNIVPIAGYTFTMTLDPSKSPADATNNLYSLTGTILDAPNGRVEFVPTAQQADQTPGVYYYDIQMVDGLGRKRTIALDKYTYTQDISKS
jgi:hypothetical protein